jgi:hypothetical protein
VLIKGIVPDMTGSNIHRASQWRGSSGHGLVATPLHQRNPVSGKVLHIEQTNSRQAKYSPP